MSTAALRASDGRSGGAVEGEYPFTQRDFENIRQLLHTESGIHLPESKATLVYSRLAKRLRRLDIPSFAAYYALVSSTEGKAERREMLAALTTNVTRFFREPHHFDHLRQQLAPWIQTARAGGRVRIWSAGCSSGQEPYSIAVTLLQTVPDLQDLDVKVLATDIDPVVLQRGREGAYGGTALEGLPEEARRNFFTRFGDRLVASDAMQRLITFNELNLMAPWPMKGRFQAIFCRNTAIYFDAPSQDRLWARLTDALTPDGRLYIGHSERVTDSRLVSDGLTAYRLGSARA